jgi:hypothetical protein
MNNYAILLNIDFIKEAFMKLNTEKRIFNWMIFFVLFVLPFLFIAFTQSIPFIKDFLDENFILAVAMTLLLIYVVSKSMEKWEHRLLLKSLDEKHQNKNIKNECQQ